MVVAEVAQAANDKQQLAPMVDKITALPDEVGRPDTLLADSGNLERGQCRCLYRRRIFWRRRHFEEALAERRVMRLPAGGDQRLDAGPGAGCHYAYS